MNWIEIMRLIVALWPIIEKILSGIEDEQERAVRANEITNVFASLLSDKQIV